MQKCDRRESMSTGVHRYESVYVDSSWISERIVDRIVSKHEVFQHYEPSYGVKVAMNLDIVYHMQCTGVSYCM